MITTKHLRQLDKLEEKLGRGFLYIKVYSDMSGKIMYREETLAEFEDESQLSASLSDLIRN